MEGLGGEWNWDAWCEISKDSVKNYAFKNLLKYILKRLEQDTGDIYIHKNKTDYE